MVTLDVKRTEKEYRELEVDSYSSLALFLKDRRQYYKKIYLGERIEDKDDESKAIMIGTLVETKLFEGEEEFDNKFYKSITDKEPTPNAMKFVHALYRHTMDATDSETGEVTRNFEDIARDAYNEAGIQKPKFPLFLIEFIGSENEKYYKQLRETKPMNKSIITISDDENANRVINEIRTNPSTAFVFNQETNDRYQIFNQHQIPLYKIDGLKLKSMYDKIIVDHLLKTIQFYDLKCTWNVENFYEEYYLRRFSYIQAYLYWYALSQKLVDLGFDYSDYEIKFPIFVVVDSINKNKPLLFQCSEEDINEAYNGFHWKGRYYPGVKETIEDVKWAKDNNEWRISRFNGERNGIVPLKRIR